MRASCKASASLITGRLLPAERERRYPQSSPGFIGVDGGVGDSDGEWDGRDGGGVIGFIGADSGGVTGFIDADSGGVTGFIGADSGGVTGFSGADRECWSAGALRRRSRQGSGDAPRRAGTPGSAGALADADIRRRLLDEAGEPAMAGTQPLPCIVGGSSMAIAVITRLDG